MHLPASTRPATGAALALLLVAACGSGSAAAPKATLPPTAAPAQSVAPTLAPTVAPATVPSAAAQVLDTSGMGDAFPIAMRVPVPQGWLMLLPSSMTPIRTAAVLNGDPADDTTWWGPGFMVVDGAKVRDPLKDAPAGSDDFVPWPASFLDYIAALPGVEVLAGPSPITVGGIEGRALTVNTPAMAPTIWIKGDWTWLGGGKTGIDPAFGRYYVELDVHGTPLLIEYDDDPARLAERIPEVEAVLSTVTFD